MIDATASAVWSAVYHVPRYDVDNVLRVAVLAGRFAGHYIHAANVIVDGKV